MSAIERCRTAALGGHVERCEDCAHLRISYNSCGNRHCPKCQAAAAKEWLADRQAELLPVPYFHVVFTLPRPIADIAYQNQAVAYDLLLKTAAESLITIAADPKHLGARIGLVWGFFCQAVVLGSGQFFVRSGKGRFSSRRLQSGFRSARKGSRDRNASGAWRLAA